MDTTTATATDLSNKRPRSPSFAEIGPPAPKAAKTHGSHLQINYLARQYQENIPLVNAEDTLPSILRLIGDYDGVLHRHESMAGNLGACPLGPILLKRFERLFDGPPRILKSHGKEASVTWLDVVEFARNKPEQFNLDKVRDGVRVCQFYTKQSRVEISEEDYVLIASGMPQKLIPPQPIVEDEEKELAALDILEKNLTQIISLADQVSARARQLNHRLKNRKTAILSRRENDIPPVQSHAPSSRSPPPGHTESVNGYARSNGIWNASTSPPAGFAAVNVRTSKAQSPDVVTGTNSSTSLSTSNFDRLPNANGTSWKGVSPEARNELVRQSITTADRETRTQLAQSQDDRRLSQSLSKPFSSTRPKPRDSSEYIGGYPSNSSTVAIPNTPVSLLPHSKTSQAERDDGGPYKAEMVARMEQMQRGERILPPCDRCRRLHMDCLKNLTACMGCTKKHAKCSWKDVREEELHEADEEDVDPDWPGEANFPKKSQGYWDHVSHGHQSDEERYRGRETMDRIGMEQEQNLKESSEHAQRSPADKPRSYSAQEDDLTRAILEEKEDLLPDEHTALRERSLGYPAAREQTTSSNNVHITGLSSTDRATLPSAPSPTTSEKPTTGAALPSTAAPSTYPNNASSTTALPPPSTSIHPSSHPQYPSPHSTTAPVSSNSASVPVNRSDYQYITRPRSGGPLHGSSSNNDNYRNAAVVDEEPEDRDKVIYASSDDEDGEDRLVRAAKEVWRRGSLPSSSSHGGR